MLGRVVEPSTQEDLISNMEIKPTDVGDIATRTWWEKYDHNAADDEEKFDAMNSRTLLRLRPLFWVWTRGNAKHMWLYELVIFSYFLSICNPPKISLVFLNYMALGQNLLALVNIKIASKWVFTPLILRILGFDAHPYYRWHLYFWMCHMSISGSGLWSNSFEK